MELKNIPECIRTFATNIPLFIAMTREILFDPKLYFAPVPGTLQIAEEAPDTFAHMTLGMFVEWWFKYPCDSHDLEGNPIYGFNDSLCVGRNFYTYYNGCFCDKYTKLNDYAGSWKSLARIVAKNNGVNIESVQPYTLQEAIDFLNDFRERNAIGKPDSLDHVFFVSKANNYRLQTQRRFRRAHKRIDRLEHRLLQMLIEEHRAELEEYKAMELTMTKFHEQKVIEAKAKKEIYLQLRDSGIFDQADFDREYGKAQADAERVLTDLERAKSRRLTKIFGRDRHLFSTDFLMSEIKKQLNY